MARSDKAPFRRELIMTEDGYFIHDEGFYVGDIKTIHINILNGQDSNYKIEGKVGRSGDWQRIFTTSKSQRHIPNIDISEFEWVRLEVFGIDEATEVIMFGYKEATALKEMPITFNENDLNRNIDQVCLLKDIKEELQKLNIYMELITGEEIK